MSKKNGWMQSSHKVKRQRPTPYRSKDIYLDWNMEKFDDMRIERMIWLGAKRTQEELTDEEKNDLAFLIDYFKQKYQ